MSNTTNQRAGGFVALLTCILISLLLIIITISMVSIETLQLRKSDDAEQSLRAYYAAEAGVEDAVSKILSGIVTGNQGCVANLSFDAGGQAGWTCQQVSFTGAPSGKLTPPDVAQTIDPGPSTYQSAVIEWGDATQTAGANYFNLPLAGGFPSQDSYNAEPSVEMTVVQYPRGAFPSNSPQLKLQNALLVPGGPAASGVVNYGAAFDTQNPVRANCGPLAAGRNDPLGPTQYNCYAVLTDLNPGLNYIFRLRSRYKKATYQMTFLGTADGSGAPGSIVSVPSGTVIIDVTAKAGQTYRRVISELPLNGSAAGELNYVMFSDTDVCKNFDVINDTEQGGCPYP